MTRVANGARVVVHGCRSNLAERDALARLAPADATVINSCAVTARAEKDARAAVRAATAAGGHVYVTGCAATLSPGVFAELGAVVVPNSAKLRPAAWGRADVMPPLAVTRQSRAFVGVQDGCDHDCTFCVTRIARGGSHSVPISEVVASVAALVDAGVAEVVLTGIDLTGHADGLGRLVQAILDKTGVRRLRLSSLDPAEAGADAALIDAFADRRLMPYLHLSLQSGDGLILKRMKRRHQPRDADQLVDRVRMVRPDVAIGADIIAGFPTETAAAHRQSCAAVERLDIVHGHIFPYSPRPGTAAARMPQVAADVARERAAELRRLVAARHDRLMATMAGQAVETVSEGQAGIAPNGMKIRYASVQPRGQLVTVAPRVENGRLVA